MIFDNGRFTQDDMPKEVGYYHAWHSNSTCDFNRYRHVIIRIITVKGEYRAISPWGKWDSDDHIIAWGDKIPIPDPPARLMVPVGNGLYSHNNVTKFKYGGGEFVFEPDDIPVGSNMRPRKPEETQNPENQN